jgi:ADP-heptose:LPS heptosyltransferase
VAEWRGRFRAALPEARVIAGLVWLANPESQSGAVRSVPVEALAPLAGLPGLGVVALQGGAAEARQGLGAVLPGAVDGLAGGEVPLPELAAAIAATDVLITVDTLAMHLAGSMGHPAVVLLSHQVPGFLPGLAEGSGWYPSLRLLRQRPGEGWEAVVRRVAAEGLSEPARGAV